MKHTEGKEISAIRIVLKLSKRPCNPRAMISTNCTQQGSVAGRYVAVSATAVKANFDKLLVLGRQVTIAQL
jgi:hypothetical protein